MKSFRGLKNISGLQCIVKADYINGQITGSLSSNRSNKQHNFTFNPIKYRRTSSLQNEINRLYFDAIEDRKCIKGVALRRVTLQVVTEDCYLEDYDLQRDYFQRETTGNTKNFDDSILVEAEHDTDKVLYFLAHIAGSQSNHICLKLIRKEREIHLSVDIHE